MVKVQKPADAVRAAVNRRRGPFTPEEIRKAVGEVIGEAAVRYHLGKIAEVVKVRPGVYERRVAQ